MGIGMGIGSLPLGVGGSAGQNHCLGSTGSVQGSDGLHLITKAAGENHLDTDGSGAVNNGKPLQARKWNAPNENSTSSVAYSGKSTPAKWTIPVFILSLINMVKTENVTESTMSTLKNSTSALLENVTESTMSTLKDSTSALLENVTGSTMSTLKDSTSALLENVTGSTMSTLKNITDEILETATASTFNPLTDAQEDDIQGILISTGIVVLAMFLLFGGIVVYAKKHPVAMKPASTVGNIKLQPQNTVGQNTYRTVSQTAPGDDRVQEETDVGITPQKPDNPDIESQPGTHKLFAETAV